MTRKTEKDDDTSSSSTSDSDESSTSSSSESDSTSTESSSIVETCTESDEEKINTTKTRTKTIFQKSPISKNEAKTSDGQKRKHRSRQITICLTHCRYEIVRKIAQKFNLREVSEDDAWNIYWTDFSVSLERVLDMRRYQMVNHFPGMNEICRKDLLARNLNRMRKLFPKDYDIYPKTWSLPADLGELQAYAHVRRNKTYICKPEMGCQGRGIFLIRNIKDLNPFGKIICQLYIARPFLIDDFKFDLRIYVLMTSCDPLRVYVYKEGLARFATAKYKTPTNTNTENSYMHLTNYAVNKFSRDYIVDDEAGSKRKLSSVYRWYETRNYDVAALTESIDSVMLKTLISAYPVLRHNYRTCYPNHDICSACFEILGFDILIDQNLKPYVLEVNHSPSFHTDARLDMEIKTGLLNDTMNMLNVKRLDRRKIENVDRQRVQKRLLVKHNPGVQNKAKIEETEKILTAQESAIEAQFAHETANCGGFRLIYPTEKTHAYDTFFEQNLVSIYQETAASQARAQCTKSQILEYNNKKQQEEIKRSGGPKEVQAQLKDKVRPESPPSDPVTKLQINVNPRTNFSHNFHPQLIDAIEELDRMKLIMHRGMLVRSLGIEAHVFQLLCQVGTIKPEEERIFRRTHGFTNTLSNQIAKAALTSRLNQQSHTNTAGGDVFQEDGKVSIEKSIQSEYNVSKRQIVTPPQLNRGNAFPTANMSSHDEKCQISEPITYHSYNLLSQTRTNVSNSTPNARKSTPVSNDMETTSFSYTSTQTNNAMTPFNGESGTVKSIPIDNRNRYNWRPLTGNYDELPLKGQSYVRPKSGISHQSSTFPNGAFDQAGTTNHAISSAREPNRSTWFPAKSIEGVEKGTWKSAAGASAGTSYNNEPTQYQGGNFNWAVPAPKLGHPVYPYTYEDMKSKIHKFVPPVTDGNGLSQGQRKGHPRGNSLSRKYGEPPLMQMFDNNPRGEATSSRMFFNPEEFTKNITNLNTSTAKPNLQNVVRPNSSLMLTGVRIGTVNSGRRQH